MGRYFIGLMLPMDFPNRLIKLRKHNRLTQQQLADAVQLHVNQIKKYEWGAAQPTLGALVNLAKVLHVSLDTLVFGEDALGPDEQLRLQFEAVCQFDEEDGQLAHGILEGLILKHQAKQSLQRQAAARTSSSDKKKME